MPAGRRPTRLDRERSSKNPPLDALRCPVATHPVNAAARWSRGGADEDARVGRGIRIELCRGAKEELREVSLAAVDVATDVIGVICLHLERVAGCARQDDIAKAGC